MELYTAYIYEDFKAYIDCRFGAEVKNVINQVDNLIVQEDGTMTKFSDQQIIVLEKED